MTKKNVKRTLAEANPRLAREWHPTRNAPLMPTDVTPFSSWEAWWMCHKGHEWNAAVSYRNQGKGCPYCSGRRVSEDNCLQTFSPKLAGEWHPARNAPLTPKDVTAGSSRKVWWICAKGHEWEALIANRSTKGAGCPYCAGQKATEENCLQARNPHLAREWHPTGNAPLTPKDVAPYSRKKVWWMCDKGHEWKTAVISRHYSVTGCPYCARKKANRENCLQIENPALAREWHPTKNAPLTPRDVMAFSGKKVWWLCDKGHEWQAYIYARSRGCGCSYCAGHRATKDNCLHTIKPGLAREWHPTKNGSWTPRDGAPYSQRQVWWKCKNGHESREKVRSRYKRGGCPVCMEC